LPLGRAIGRRRQGGNVGGEIVLVEEDGDQHTPLGICDIAIFTYLVIWE
jgi:hypothetical protein